MGRIGRNILSWTLPFLLAGGLRGQDVPPFTEPDPEPQLDARRHGIQVALRFGYLAEDRAASSLRRRTEFNRQGLPTLVHEFADSGGIASKARYTYATDGKTLRTASIELFDTAADLTESRSYAFDPEGRLLEYRSTDEKGLEVRVGYTYDARGNLLSEQEFEVDGLPGAVTVHDYNARGLRTETVSYDIAQNVRRRQVNVYRDGLQTAEKHYRGKGLLLYTDTLLYDEQGRKIRRERTARGGLQMGWEEWEYDEEGRIGERRLLEPGDERPMKEVISYDARGRRTEFISIDGDGSIFQWFKYSWDSTGAGAGFARLRPDGSPDHEFTEKFAADGRILERISFYPDGSGDHRTLFRYDDKGLPLEEVHTSHGEEEAVYWFVFERF